MSRRTQHTKILDGGWVERSCLNKAGDKTFEHALDDIPRIRLQYGAGELTAYRCVVCKGWHLTHVKGDEEAS